MISVLPFVLLFGFILLREFWKRWNYDLHKIPGAPTFPFLGHMPHFIKGDKTIAVNVWLQNWREKLCYPKLMRICGVGSTSVVITDAHLAREVFTSRSHDFKRGGPFYRQFHRFLMNHDSASIMYTTNATTPHVKAIRRAYATSFTSSGLKKIFQKQILVMEKGEDYIKHRCQEGTIDVQDFFRRLMLDVIGKAGMDIELGGLDSSSPLYNLLITCGHHLRALGTNPFLDFVAKLLPFLQRFRKIDQDFSMLKNEWMRIVEAVNSRGDPEDDDLSLAANLKRVCIPGTNNTLPSNVLSGELATVVLGGFDTVSHQLSWIFALLATHPQVVQKIIDELKSHGLYGKGVRELKFEDLSQLEYVGAVVKEGMRRIHVLVFVHSRHPIRDIVLGGYRIPKGTAIYLAGNMTMNCEPEWIDHLAFKPERWLNEKVNVSERFYIPFGIGERDCPGMKLAVQSMKVAIVYFASKFDFELVGDTIDSLTENAISGVVFEAADGINMKITPRAWLEIQSVISTSNEMFKV
eukprot:g3827.t1